METARAAGRHESRALRKAGSVAPSDGIRQICRVGRSELSNTWRGRSRLTLSGWALQPRARYGGIGLFVVEGLQLLRTLARMLSGQSGGRWAWKAVDLIPIGVKSSAEANDSAAKVPGGWRFQQMGVGPEYSALRRPPGLAPLVPGCSHVESRRCPPQLRK